jgi:hypothetical protein
MANAGTWGRQIDQCKNSCLEAGADQAALLHFHYILAL